MDDKEIAAIIQKAVAEAMKAAIEAQTINYSLLVQRMDALMKTVEKHDHTLYGNGKEGLTSIVDRT